MPEEIKDVNTEESSASEQVVNEQTESDQQSEQVDSQGQETSTQEVKPEVKPDRPEINYAMEALRKVNELSDTFKQFTQTQQPQQQKPQYTKAQLRAFSEQSSNPNEKVWALEEIDKLEKEERTTEMRQLFEGYNKKTQEEVERKEATRFVAQNFPECFVRDEAGNPISWDNNSPLTQKIGEYMRNPALANNPQGLVAAAKMAAFDLGVSQNRKLQTKVNNTTAQLKREQKKQLITGTGTTPSPEGSKGRLQKLAEHYYKTGDKSAFKELAKAKGLIPNL